MYKRLLKFHITDIKLHLLGIICCLQKLHKEALPLITTKTTFVGNHLLFAEITQRSATSNNYKSHKD